MSPRRLGHSECVYKLCRADLQSPSHDFSCNPIQYFGKTRWPLGTAQAAILGDPATRQRQGGEAAWPKRNRQEWMLSSNGGSPHSKHPQSSAHESPRGTAAREECAICVAVRPAASIACMAGGVHVGSDASSPASALLSGVQLRRGSAHAPGHREFTFPTAWKATEVLAL